MCVLCPPCQARTFPFVPAFRFPDRSRLLHPATASLRMDYPLRAYSGDRTAFGCTCRDGRAACTLCISSRSWVNLFCPSTPTCIPWPRRFCLRPNNGSPPKAERSLRLTPLLGCLESRCRALAQPLPNIRQKPKRLTMAQLAQQQDSIMEVISRLSEQMDRMQRESLSVKEPADPAWTWTWISAEAGPALCLSSSIPGSPQESCPMPGGLFTDPPIMPGPLSKHSAPCPISFASALPSVF